MYAIAFVARNLLVSFQHEPGEGQQVKKFNKKTISDRAKDKCTVVLMRKAIISVAISVQL